MVLIISANQFISQFSGIRPALNWGRFFRENWSVEYFSVSNCDEFGRFYTPWHKNDKGELRDGTCITSTPLQIKDCPFPVEIEDALREGNFDKSFLENDHPEITLPSYKLSEGKYLLLDGNHRSASLWRTKKNFTAHIFAIVGPIDPTALPGLAYWEAA